MAKSKPKTFLGISIEPSSEPVSESMEISEKPLETEKPLPRSAQDNDYLKHPKFAKFKIEKEGN